MHRSRGRASASPRGGCGRRRATTAAAARRDHPASGPGGSRGCARLDSGGSSARTLFPAWLGRRSRLLARWHLGDPAAIAAAVTQESHAHALAGRGRGLRPFSRPGQSGAASRRARLAHARRAGKRRAHATARLRLEELSLHPHPAVHPERFPGGDARSSRQPVLSRASSGSPT